MFGKQRKKPRKAISVWVSLAEQLEKNGGVVSVYAGESTFNTYFDKDCVVSVFDDGLGVVADGRFYHFPFDRIYEITI